MRKVRSNQYMKRHLIRAIAILTAFLAYALLSNAFAQPQLGILSGVNLSKLRIDGPASGLEYQTTTGWKAGMVLEIPFRNSSFSLQFEPMYVQKGAEQAVTFPEPGLDEMKMKLELDYLALPLLFKYSFGEGNIRPYIVAGPEAGFLLNAKMEDHDLKDDFNDLDFGLTGGAGFDFSVGDNAIIFVEGRYGYGLNNLNTHEDSPLKLYNQGVQIMAGVRVPLGLLGNEEDCVCTDIKGEINLGDLRFENIRNNQDDLYIFTTLDVDFSAFLDGEEGEKEILFKYDTKKSFALTKLTKGGALAKKALSKGELIFDKTNSRSIIDSIKEIKEKDKFGFAQNEEKAKIDCDKIVKSKFGPIQIGHRFKISSLEQAIDVQESYFFVKIHIEGYLISDNKKQKLIKEIQGYLVQHKEVEGAWKFREKP